MMNDCLSIPTVGQRDSIFYIVLPWDWVDTPPTGGVSHSLSFHVRDKGVPGQAGQVSRTKMR